MEYKPTIMVNHPNYNNEIASSLFTSICGMKMILECSEPDDPSVNYLKRRITECQERLDKMRKPVTLEEYRRICALRERPEDK